MKILGLIPSRLKSTRLHEKPLLKIGTLPMIVHTYRRAMFSKLLSDVYVCCDDKKIVNICRKYNIKYIKTSASHRNGTERIAEAYKKLRKKYDFIIDIQGDEPLLQPKNIDNVIRFHKKNYKSDIILPVLKSKFKSSKNIVKVLLKKNKDVMYISRYNLPYQFKEQNNLYYKHLSIISFKPKSLIKFFHNKPTFSEKIEGIELLRALEIGMKIKSVILKGDSFSVDIKEHYTKSKKYILKDSLYIKYK